MGDDIIWLCALGTSCEVLLSGLCLMHIYGVQCDGNDFLQREVAMIHVMKCIVVWGSFFSVHRIPHAQCYWKTLFAIKISDSSFAVGWWWGWCVCVGCRGSFFRIGLTGCTMYLVLYHLGRRPDGRAFQLCAPPDRRTTCCVRHGPSFQFRRSDATRSLGVHCFSHRQRQVGHR